MDGLVFYAKARAFKARAKVKKLALKTRPKPKINFPVGATSLNCLSIMIDGWMDGWIVSRSSRGLKDD